MLTGRKILRFSYPLMMIIAAIVTIRLISSDSNAQENSPDGQSRLCVVWTSGDKEVAMKMVYMYTLNAKKQGWFENVRFVIWGPSSKLLSEDKELQDYLGKMKEAGVELQACIACANMYGVTEKLRSLGVEVKGMGRPLSEMLKSDWETVTF